MSGLTSLSPSLRVKHQHALFSWLLRIIGAAIHVAAGIAIHRRESWLGIAGALVLGYFFARFANEVEEQGHQRPKEAVVRPPQRLVILESPYAGNIDLNIDYARAAVRDSLSRGESPIASHLLYT